MSVFCSRVCIACDRLAGLRRRWKEGGRALSLLSKDFESKPVVATEFIIDGSTLYMLSADTARNIQVSTAAPTCFSIFMSIFMSIFTSIFTSIFISTSTSTSTSTPTFSPPVAQIFNYSDTSVDSWKGQKLVLKSEANVGCRINRFQRFKVVKSAHPAKQRALQRHGALYCSVEGALGSISPMDEMAYR